MALPAIKEMLITVFKTVMRFSFTIGCAIAATITIVMLMDLQHSDTAQQYLLMRIVMVLYIGLIAGISIALTGERFRLNKGLLIAMYILLMMLMYFYFIHIPGKPNSNAIARFFLLILALHALVAFAPCLVRCPPNGYWQYNRQLFIRILTSFFYSFVLFVGLFLALFAINQLFNVSLDNTIYFKLFVVIMGIFNTTLFLSGIPEDLEALDAVTDFPKGLKIFTQFILLPLVTLYLVILYAYGIKILNTEVWPVGWVSYLVLGFSIAGILALLLIWPLRNEVKQQWIRTYSRYFFLALPLLIVLLFIAIGKRVLQYGITENRYFILALAIWLLLIDLYFLFSKVKNIKIIPLMLFIFSMFSAFSPWNAFRVSEQSQLKRLKRLLAETKRLEKGMAVKSTFHIPLNSAKEISSTSQYLITEHGLHSIQPIFSINLDSLCSAKDSSNKYSFKPGKVLRSLNIDYVNSYDGGALFGNQVNLNVKDNNITLTKDFDYLVEFNIPNYNKEKKTRQVFKLAMDSLTISWIDSLNTLRFRINNEAKTDFNVLSSIYSLSKTFGYQHYDLPASTLQFDFNDSINRYRLLIHSINGRLTEQQNGLELYNMSAKLLISRK